MTLMSTKTNEQLGSEAVVRPELPAPSVVRRSALRLGRQRAQIVAALGRVGVTWLPIFALSAHHYDSTLQAVVFSALVAVGWIVALRSAFSTARSTRYALGVWVVAAVGAATGLVLVSALNAWLPSLDLSIGELLQMALAVFALSALWETLAQSSTAAEQRVLLVGVDPAERDLIDQLVELESSPYTVVGFVVDDAELAPDGIASLPDIVDAYEPDLVVMVNQRPETVNALLDVASAGFRVVGLPTFYEHAFGRVPVRLVTPTWFMSVLHLYRQPYSRATKRIFDLVVAGTALVLVAPLLPLIALGVRRTSGPIVFRQVRLGEGGAPFTILKFRTMQEDAERNGAVWASVSDARVTRFGAFLRKTRLDELPQLWNVLRGDMSIVGPRPERPEFVAELEATVPFWSRRLLVKPGVTGWAQLHRGYTADAAGTADKVAYDLWYLRHRSLVLDLVICAKTFAVLVTGSGAR
jgi:exopolysaccharide biosynthesis polyprenyl glycosylphosphotransferase